MWRYFLCLESFCNPRGTSHNREVLEGEVLQAATGLSDLFFTDIIALAGRAVTGAGEAWKHTIWYHYPAASTMLITLNILQIANKQQYHKTKTTYVQEKHAHTVSSDGPNFAYEYFLKS